MFGFQIPFICLLIYILMNEYLRSFIIGSSWPAFVFFFYVVGKYDDIIKNYSYSSYTLVAPIFLGCLNMFGLFLSHQYHLERTNRFLITGIIGATLISITITLFKVYNLST